MKMNERNQQLKSALNTIAPKERIQAANAVPEYDTVTLEGHPAYDLPDEVKLLSMLNTLRLEPQFYRNEESTMRELRELVERVALKDPYFVAQAICWSRNVGEKMRSVSHLAAALFSPFASGNDWAKRFYGPFNKKTQSGGCIFRPDDMREIKDVNDTLTGSPLSSAMRKGFASAIESFDNYQLAKYRDVIIDISNLAHPDPNKSSAEIEIDVDGKKVKMKTLDAIMKGYTVSADTWEVANSEAGQIVAEAVKEGKLDEEEAKVVLAEAKNDNWEALLNDGRLGMLAALRNIRNMMKDARPSVIDKLCELVSNGEAIKKSGVMPYQIDIAYEIVNSEFGRSPYDSQVKSALMKGYEDSIPNLKEAMPGKTLVVLDCSGSMTISCCNGRNNYLRSSCIDKASLIAATVAKGVGADVICFGTTAQWYEVNKDMNVFDMAQRMRQYNLGGTNFSAAFRLIHNEKKAYDRILVLSDNMCNSGFTREVYKDYIHDVCNPYMYCVDFASYGTTQFKNDKVANYFGYGYAMFDDIASREFNPSKVIDKVRSYVI